MIALGFVLLFAVPQAYALTAQIITGFAPATPITYSAGKTFALSATGGGSGNPVAFASTTTSICTVASNNVSVLTVGTCKLTANQAGNSTYSAAPQISANIVVNKGSQTITFAPLTDKILGAGTFTLSATSDSGPAVTFTSTTTSVCTVSGSTVTLVAAGTCTIAANQAGNTQYSAAPQVAQSFTVAKKIQTITFAALSDKPFGVAAFSISATSSSGLTVVISSVTTSVCTVSASKVTVVSTGTCTIAANQAGNGTYSPAQQVTQSFNVTPGAQSITFPMISGKTVGATPYTATATSTSGLTVTITSATAAICAVNGKTITFLGAGICTLNANQPGNANYGAAPQVQQLFRIDPGSQVITFSALANKLFGAAPFTVSATSSSGLAVTLTSDTTNICTVAGSTVTLVSTGTCTIFAYQEGNNDYLNSNTVYQSFNVAPGTQMISFAPLPGKAFGSAPFNLVANSSSGLPVTFTTGTLSVCTISGSTVTLVSMGTCTIAADQAGNANISAAPQVTQSFTIATNQPPSISLTSPSAGQHFHAPASLTLSATPTDSDGSIAQVAFYNGESLLGTVTQAPFSITLHQVLAGSYNITAQAKDDLGATGTTSPISVTVDPQTELTLVASPNNSNAPANITLTASTANLSGTVTQVEFFNGVTSLGVISQAPFTFSWNNLAAGIYTVTAKATDSLGVVTVSQEVDVTVGDGTGAEQVYYVEVDHLKTPRVVTDKNGTPIWQWGQDEPFGDTPPNEDPGNVGKPFVLNVRFPGQYFDQETNTHYNYHRDYDPRTGRYLQSDPIGLSGGVNTYSYVNNRPIQNIDPSGLIKWKGDMYSVSAADYVGGGIYNFDLKSECVGGKYAYVHVFASGVGLGAGFDIRTPFTGGVGGIEFNDGNVNIDPNVFHGKFQIFSVAAGIGVVGGYSFIELGHAISTPSAKPDPSIGVDASVSAFIGRSSVWGAEIKECDCNKR